MPNADETALKQAIKGLLYMSETDAPFKLVRWDKKTSKLTPTDILELSKNDPRAHVAEESVDEFFADLMGEANDDADKYRTLLTVIKSHLSDPRVYRIGQMQLGIYIIGEAGGSWLGIKTRAVET